ncbi:hypothetical protein [Ensifer aridi]|uniref:hypothetical protein n=1 Tax=Ensifer aridi TaxID=1708715 RepID=UPI00111C8489|nr:hypothetical protein [Ensifer aridi]
MHAPESARGRCSLIAVWSGDTRYSLDAAHHHHRPLPFCQVSAEIERQFSGSDLTKKVHVN